MKSFLVFGQVYYSKRKKKEKETSYKELSMKKSCGINSITNAKRYREVYKISKYLGQHIREFTQMFDIHLLTDDMVTDLYRQCLLQYNKDGELYVYFVENIIELMRGV